METPDSVMTAPAPPAELRRPFDTATLAGRPHHLEIEATGEECAALARRFDLVAVDRLSARFALTALPGGLVRVEGRLEAAVVQRCVLTLGPVAACISEPVGLSFTHEAAAPDQRKVEIAAEAEDPPEPMTDGVIDLGEAVAQQLALALDPYPRAPGISLGDVLPKPAGDARAEGPFGALATLKKSAE